MKKLLLIFLLAFSLTSCLIIQPQKVKAQDYIAWVNQPILEAGGYGMLYNWFCTQQQPSVEYGYLYNWYVATDNRGVTAAGFHVPTKNDVQILIAYLGGNSSVADKVRSQNPLFWNIPGSNTSNLGLVGSGRRIDEGLFDKIKNSFFMWTVTTTGEGDWNWVISYSNISILGHSSIYSRFVGRSIRPIKDSTTLTHGQTGIYVDPSGIIYPTICIGTQEWVACNIMTKHYRNGDAIPEVTDNTAWSNATTGMRCSYLNIEANAGTTKKISSSDSFIVPTKTIWENFFNSLDTYDSGLTGWPILGTQLRESSWLHWLNYYDEEYGIEGTDDYGFKLVGSGARSYDGTFIAFKTSVQIWSSTDMLDGNPYAVFTAFSIDEITDSNGAKQSGYSIRLCDPATSNPNGYVGSYTQNDGTVIPTIVINGVEWTMNLKETKWSDGTDIQNITDNTDWAALTTGARCVYNNDESNK